MKMPLTRSAFFAAAGRRRAAAAGVRRAAGARKRRISRLGVGTARRHFMLLFQRALASYRRAFNRHKASTARPRRHGAQRQAPPAAKLINAAEFSPRAK